MKEYRSKGTLCVKTEHNLVYKFCDLEYIYNEDDSFKYIFTPNYSVIKLIPTKYFQGIPGLNLDLKRKEYIRENMTPVFIKERVPQESRIDYYKFLKSVNLDFMDPILYLIRTDLQYSGDNIYLLPYEEKETINYDNIKSHKNNNALIKDMLIDICKGNNVILHNQLIDDENRKGFYEFLLEIYSRNVKNNKQKQKEGIKKAKEIGKYKGRKPKPFDYDGFIKLLEKVNNKEMTAKKCAEELGISIDKYYREKKKFDMNK